MESKAECSEQDVFLRVPEDLASCSIGFALDAGGSVTKLLYRSKEDYCNGKRIRKSEGDDDGLLRLRQFSSIDDEALVEFLRSNCDISESAKENSKGWFVTGVHTQRLGRKLEEVFGIKVKSSSEYTATYKGLRSFCSLLPDCRPMAPPQEIVAAAFKMGRDLAQILNADIERDVEEPGTDSVAVEEEVTKPMTAVNHTDELTKDTTVDWPCLFVLCGSATSLIIMKSTGYSGIASYSYVGGKTFLALGRLLCGANNFKELVEMAARGDGRKVDVSTDDLRYGPSYCDDTWYTHMPEAMPAYTLGKLVGGDLHSVNYTKDDLAVGLVNIFCGHIVKCTVSYAKQCQVKSIVFSGSFVNSEFIRTTLQKLLLFEIFLQAQTDREQIKKVLFLPHSGFTVCFGVWFRNCETEDEYREEKGKRSALTNGAT